MITRFLAIAVLVTAIALSAFLIFGSGGGDYTVKARFQNAGQVVRGGLVEIAGKQVGTVTDQRLTPDGLAELTMEIEPEWAPIARGTRAQVRQFGLSGPASRYVELREPTGEQRAGDLPDGGVIEEEDTVSNVDIDEIFAIFDKRTRSSLKGIFRGSARQYGGAGRQANAGLVYLDPALVSASRLFAEINRDTPKLRRFIRETSGLVGDVAERRDDLASLVSNLADTTGAIARPPGALGRAIHELPPFMRRANTTYVNLRATLDDLDPLVREAKPVAKKLRPYTAELRTLVQNAEPTVRDLARVIRKPGRTNDLVELAKLTPRLRDIAVGPVTRNGEERAGALPAAAEALASATPRLAFARPYSPDFTGWLDDFSHSGNYDALGGFARIGTHVNAFSFKPGSISMLAPAARAESFKSLALTGQNNRCPGSAERDPGDRSTPFRPTPGFNCDPTQVPPGR
jgi:phospholipid/cholesterol/gamma-HCH transport system substrate-binding protein